MNFKRTIEYNKECGAEEGRSGSGPEKHGGKQRAGYDVVQSCVAAEREKERYSWPNRGRRLSATLWDRFWCLCLIGRSIVESVVCEWPVELALCATLVQEPYNDFSFFWCWL